MPRPTALLAALLLAAGLPAQTATAVWPTEYAAKAAPNAHQSPFTVIVDAAHSSHKTRNMAILDASTLPFNPGSVLLQIAMRPDENYTFPIFRDGRLRVILDATAKHDPLTVSHHFQANFTGNQVTVYDGPFTLPAANPTAGGQPHPFTLVVPFSQPWIYQGGNLLVDVLFGPSPTASWAATGSSYRIDALDLPGDRKNGVLTYLKDGCTGSNALKPSSINSYAWECVPGQEFQIRCDSLTLANTPAEQYAFNWIGLSGTGWAGLTLPFGLGPLGLDASCLLQTGLEAIQVVPRQEPDFTLLTTRARALWFLPNDPALAGGIFFTQWLCPDSGVKTPLPLTVSNGRKMAIGSPGRAYRFNDVYLYGATGDAVERAAITDLESAAVFEFMGYLK